MWSNLFLSALVVASLAVLVRNLLYNFPQWQNRLPRAFSCGFCFTYWLALAYALLFDPLSGWSPAGPALSPINALLQLIFEWLILAFLAVVFRFGYVAIQELVNYFVHNLNVEHQHQHQDQAGGHHH